MVGSDFFWGGINVATVRTLIVGNHVYAVVLYFSCNAFILWCVVCISGLCFKVIRL